MDLTLKNLSILIVEDELLIAENLRLTLLEFCNNAFIASSCDTALEILNKESVDIILMDIMLNTDKDGIDTALEIHNKFDIPVIYITANSDKDVFNRALTTNPYGFLVKPVSNADLLNTINVAVYKHSLQKELLENTQRYYNLFEQSNDAIILFSENGQIDEVNTMATNLLEYSKDELQSLNFIELFPNAKQANAIDIITKQSLKKGVETQFQRSNKTLIDVIIKTKILNNTGKYQAVIENITKKKIYERIQKQSHKRISNLIENNLDAMLVLDREKTVLFANPAADDLFDKNHEQLVGSTLKLDINLNQTELAQLSISNGKEKTIETRTTTMMWEENKVYLMTLRDITERLVVENEKNKLNTAIHQAAEGIFITNQENKITYVNPAFEKISGYTQNEVINKNPNILNSGLHDSQFYENLYTELKSGRTWKGSFIDKKKNGSFFEVESTISPVKNENGEIISYVAVNRDVTNERLMEKQLRQAQKLQAIGTLAGGIAHDFNNILTPIFGYLEMVSFDGTLSERTRKSLQNIEKASKRAKNLVEQILTFSRGIEQKTTVIQPKLIITEALKLIRASIPTTIHIDHKIDKACGSIVADPTQFHQVIMNLCTNAFHAMREKGNGTLTVTLETIKSNDPYVIKYPHLAQNYILLKVSDTGVGMDETTRKKIFVPFFTTKEQGEGTGLGLATVHGIITGMKGEIFVESQINVGTTFLIYIPQSKEDDGQNNTDEKKIAHGSEYIMYVDDEQEIANMAKRALETFGYNVEQLYSSTDALYTFKENPNKYNLVISDQTMPNMTGLELAERLKHFNKNLPVIICTGYSESLTKEKLDKVGINALIMKPFDFKEMSNVIRQVLDESKTIDED